MKQVKFLEGEEKINAFLKSTEVYNPEFHFAIAPGTYTYVMIVYETEPGYREAAR